MRRIKVFLAAIILTGAIAIALFVRPSPPSLIDRATLIGEYVDWYEWLPDDHLATSRPDRRPGYRIWLVNSDSKLAPADESGIGKEIAGLPTGMQWTFSPDGRRVSTQMEGRFDSLIVNYLGQTTALPPVPGRNARWAPDGAFLVALAGPPSTPILRRYTFSESGSSRTGSTKPELPKWSPVRGFRGGAVAVPGQPKTTIGANSIQMSAIPGGSFAVQWSAPAPRLLGVTGRNTAILTTWNRGQIQDVDLFEVSLATSGKPLRTFTIEIPKGYRVDEVQLSPQADRLVMRLYGSSVKSGFVRWLERVGLFRASGRSAVNEYWVADLNGNNRKKLGEVSSNPHGALPVSDVPTRIRWLPDGKRISFTTPDGLYILNIDE